MPDSSSGPVTFLATDIVGSVELWQRDTVAMSAALAVHDRMLREIIPRYGGQVVKGQGDGVWAAFNEPLAALDAALAIQVAMHATSWGALGELRVRIVVHTGEAELRDGEYYGPTANRLARFIERAHGGQPLVSEATVRLAGPQAMAAFTLQSVGELRLRSLLEPLRAFELAPPGADLAAMRRDRENRVGASVPSFVFPSPSRLVGREAELSAVWGVLERGRETGQVVLISAPAGTGKSTLVGELARRARQAGVLCLAGGAYERAGVVPLGPLRDALADYLLSQPAERLPMVVGDGLADLSLVVPELTYRSGRAEPAEERPDLARLSGAVFACLQTLAERQPVLLCIEDLHVADDGTLALIRHLVQRATRSPLTVCATFRGDEIEGHQELERLVATLVRDGATRIDLAPLGRDHSGELIAGLLDGPPSERLRDALYAVSEENPLFLEQSTLALREQGQIGRAGHVWHVIGDVSVGFPTVARDVLVQRLRRLSRRCDNTVLMAAVLGQSFEYEALSAALAPESMLPLVEDLEEATEAHVLREVPSGYAFTHALLREAVYGGLSLPRQLLLHGQAGEALERLAGPHAAEHASALAHHFVRAGRAPKMAAKALFYSLEAGRRAAGLLLHHEAREHFSRVCDLIDRGDVPVTVPTHLEVLEGRLTAEHALGMWLAMIATAERILEATSDSLSSRVTTPSRPLSALKCCRLHRQLGRPENSGTRSLPWPRRR